ncbi:MAG: hypothetical protein ACD_13C00031G0001 [uncultured bacterium]|nr:MAG: hypothetical protein ACD_13C00031G0001 [uncultured bacterium]
MVIVPVFVGVAIYVEYALVIVPVEVLLTLDLIPIPVPKEPDAPLKLTYPSMPRNSALVSLVVLFPESDSCKPE